MLLNIHYTSHLIAEYYSTIFVYPNLITCPKGLFPEISVINIALKTTNLLLVSMNMDHLDSMYK